jgi:hypothetical protein
MSPYDGHSSSGNTVAHPAGHAQRLTPEQSIAPSIA